MQIPSPVPMLILLTGPAASGKTTVADKWARIQSSPCAHLSIDDVRHFVKAGYVDPAGSWTSDHPIQTDFARNACADLGRRYLELGYSCIIDDAIFPTWPDAGYQKWRDSLGDTPHQLIVLMPSLETVQARNNHPSRIRPLPSTQIERIHSMMQLWKEQQVLLIDNSNLSPEETSHQIQQLLTGT